jgi:hypothetical protein
MVILGKMKNVFEFASYSKLKLAGVFYPLVRPRLHGFDTHEEEFDTRLYC